jgi:hypothetical protein
MSSKPCTALRGMVLPLLALMKICMLLPICSSLFRLGAAAAAGLAGLAAAAAATSAASSMVPSPVLRAARGILRSPTFRPLCAVGLGKAKSDYYRALGLGRPGVLLVGSPESASSVLRRRRAGGAAAGLAEGCVCVSVATPHRAHGGSRQSRHPRCAQRRCASAGTSGRPPAPACWFY